MSIVIFSTIARHFCWTGRPSQLFRAPVIFDERSESAIVEGSQATSSDLTAIRIKRRRFEQILTDADRSSR
jgi:hypothetical protein